MHIQAPGDATRHVVAMTDTSSIYLDFNTDNSTFERSGNDLTITFENGGSVAMTDFFVVGDSAELPRLSLSDGTEVSATEFLQSMNPNMDLTTAAGPVNSLDGSGTNYDDGAGDLLSGVDRLGDLGTFHWGMMILPKFHPCFPPLGMLMLTLLSFLPYLTMTPELFYIKQMTTLPR